VTLWLQTPTLG
jgi:hypothetical protein